MTSKKKKGKGSALGIVPAAGEASRWGAKVYKELLPIGDELMIERVARSMKLAGATDIVVVTTDEKEPIHREFLDRDIMYCWQDDRWDRDIWSAIRSTLVYCNRDIHFFGMPDTYFPLNAFEKMTVDTFTLGVFLTTFPHRYDVEVNGEFVNKPEIEGAYYAWGVAAWTREVAQFWMENDDMITGYTHAFNLARANFAKCKMTHMDYYYDVADWGRYVELIKAIT